MGSPRSIVHLASIGLRRWAVSPRVWVLGALGVLWMHHLLSPLLSFSQSVSVAISPWVFPFAMAEWYSAMVVMLGVVVLFCDAPFTTGCTPYECIRSGKGQWVVGQIVYVVIASAVLAAFLVAVSVVCVAPNLDFTTSWGRVLKTLAQTTAGVEYVEIPVSYRLMVSYSPVGALMLSSTILFLESVFVGLMVFTTNMLVAKKAGGIVVGMLLAFLPAFANVVGVPRAYFFAPTAWANLDMLASGGRAQYPSLAYVLAVLCGAIVVLIAVIMLVHRRAETEVLLPV